MDQSFSEKEKSLNHDNEERWKEREREREVKATTIKRVTQNMDDLTVELIRFGSVYCIRRRS